MSTRKDFMLQTICGQNLPDLAMVIGLDGFQKDFTKSAFTVCQHPLVILCHVEPPDSEAV